MPSLNHPKPEWEVPVSSHVGAIARISWRHLGEETVMASVKIAEHKSNFTEFIGDRNG